MRENTVTSSNPYSVFTLFIVFTVYNENGDKSERRARGCWGGSIAFLECDLQGHGDRYGEVNICEILK